MKESQGQTENGHTEYNGRCSEGDNNHGHHNPVACTV